MLTEVEVQKLKRIILTKGEGANRDGQSEIETGVLMTLEIKYDCGLQLEVFSGQLQFLVPIAL